MPDTAPRYEPFSWHHWPDHFWMSYQFRRGPGETQEGGGAVSEVFQAASRMKPGDAESWHEEWTRIAVSGSSLGGYYSARAAARDHRLAACISHGAIWDIHARWKTRDDSHGLAKHIRWVFGAKTMAEAIEIARPFTLEGVLKDMRCPYLVIHGGHDVLGVNEVQTVHDYARANGVNATLRLTTEEKTGAEHCQHDNPTLGQELMLDWLADQFGIDQRKVAIPPG